MTTRTSERLATVLQTIELAAYMADIVHWLNTLQQMTPYKRDGLGYVKRCAIKMRFPMKLTYVEYAAIKAVFTPYKDFPFAFAAYCAARRLGATPKHDKRNDAFALLYVHMKKD